MTLGGLDEDVSGRPSRLPGWTVGHVLTHVARNAESHVRILEGALAGEHLQQYEGGWEGRAAGIEAGAGRPSHVVIDDVVVTFARLEDAWAKMTPEAWDGYGTSVGGEVMPCRQMPFLRCREVEIHHVDLGLGYEVSDWPAAYVAAELPIAAAGLAERVVDSGARAGLLAWLVGRGEQPAELRLEPWKA